MATNFHHAILVHCGFTTCTVLLSDVFKKAMTKICRQDFGHPLLAPPIKNNNNKKKKKIYNVHIVMNHESEDSVYAVGATLC